MTTHFFQTQHFSGFRKPKKAYFYHPMRTFINRSKESITLFLTTYFDGKNQWLEAEDKVQLLAELVALIRPNQLKHLEKVELIELLFVLKNHTEIRNNFKAFVKQLFSERKFKQILTDAGILHDVNFLSEIKNRLFSKVLPMQPAKERVAYILNQVFYKKTDAQWVEKIPLEQLYELYDLLQSGEKKAGKRQSHVSSQLIIAMTILIRRCNGRAMDTEVMKMVPEFDNLESPFSGFEKELLEIDNEIKNSPGLYISHEDLSYKQLTILHQQCEQFIEKAFLNSRKYGISLRVNQNMLRIKQQLERLKVLIPYLATEKPEDVRTNEVGIALLLIRYNCYQNNLQSLISDSTQLLAFEITQHTAKTGEHYITQTKGEYNQMFRSALGGGLIVGLLVIFKLLLSKLAISDFGQAFLYSMNYSLGFVAIYLFGFTLATKQTAMTASAIISALKEGIDAKIKNDLKYQAFAILFARLFRSQFIAFVGNVIMAFPVAMLGIWLIELSIEQNIAETKGAVMLSDISPIHSLALFHAAIAGVYLFLSGIISGSTANKDKHNQIYFRIQEHPILKRTIGKERAYRLSKWYEKKWAGIISNFWFGVFMGSTASIGVFLGLNLDIRHITFASGNLALGLYGESFEAGFWVIFWAVVGIGLIGLINFMVSFSLSLGLAFRSKRLPVRELRPVIASIWKHAKDKPVEFFFPHNSTVHIEDDDGLDKTKYQELKKTDSNEKETVLNQTITLTETDTHDKKQKKL
jgi:site-specific recombinase